jgi:orotate phosphoribosyltransferase
VSLLDEFRARDVYRTGHFELSSGRHSDTYLQCALALQDPTFARRLGHELADRLDGVDATVVASPAMGGVLAGFVVAQAMGRRFVFTERKHGEMTLRRGQQVGAGDRVVVVEDVLTTGGSARECADVLEERGAQVVAYAARVDRSTSDHPLPYEATALVNVDPRTWDPADCPLCADGVPIDSPGSRRTS